jgi:hypothetical protein
MTECGLIEARRGFRKFTWKKGIRTYLPAGVGAGSSVEKVGGDLVRV